MEDSSFKFGVIRATSMEKSNILTISELCEIAGVSRSGYYAWRSSEQKRAAREAQDPAADEEIRSCLSDPQGKSIPADAEGDPDEQHGGKPCEAGV